MPTALDGLGHVCYPLLPDGLVSVTRANVNRLSLMARANVIVEIDQQRCLQCAGDLSRVFQGVDDAPGDHERACLAAPGEDGDADPAIAAYASRPL